MDLAIRQLNKNEKIPFGLIFHADPSEELVKIKT